MPDDLIIKPLYSLQNQYLAMIEKNLILEMNDQVRTEASDIQNFIYEHNLGLKETLMGEQNGNK